VIHAGTSAVAAFPTSFPEHRWPVRSCQGGGFCGAFATLAA
jgi:hypothetical protein